MERALFKDQTLPMTPRAVQTLKTQRDTSCRASDVGLRQEQETAMLARKGRERTVENHKTELVTMTGHVLG